VNFIWRGSVGKLESLPTHNGGPFGILQIAKSAGVARVKSNSSATFTKRGCFDSEIPSISFGGL